MSYSSSSQQQQQQQQPIGLGESAFASSSAIQQLLPSASAPVDEQVHVLRGAVVVTMEEVERLRGAMMVENGKLQRELRDVVRNVATISSSNNNTTDVVPRPDSTDNLLRPGGALRNKINNNNNNNSLQQQQQSSMMNSNNNNAEYDSRLEYLEHAIRGIQQHQSLHTPVAMENAISQCSIFLRKADSEVQRVVTQMQDKMNSWQRIMDSFVTNNMMNQQQNNNNNNNNNNSQQQNQQQNSSSSGEYTTNNATNNNSTGNITSRMMNNGGATASSREASAAAASGTGLQGAYANLDVVNDVKRMVQGRIMELSSYIDQELAAHRSSIIGLEDKMGAVVETVSQMETESNAFRAAVSRPHIRNTMASQVSSKAAALDISNSLLRPSGMMTSPVLEDLSSPPRNTTNNNTADINNNNNNNNTSTTSNPTQTPNAGKRHLDASAISAGALRSGVRGGGGAGTSHISASGSTAEAIQSLLREFTAVESSVIKDEILKQLDGDANLTRRRLDERNRNEQVTNLRGDVVRIVTSLETVQEDHSRMERQQQDLHRAFQRLEQHFNLLQHKTEGDVRTELNRMEALQKSFFVRQEQLIAAERQTMITNVTEEVSRIQQKHADEMRISERRRMDDLQAAQKQIRDDFVAFAEKQRKDLETAIAHVKDDFTNLSNQANDNVARSLANATDATRRSFMNTTDEMRKNYNKIADDMRRLTASTEETMKRSQEQQAFLQQRLQQVIDEQTVRVDRMGDDLALRLNNAVEEEVKRMTTSSENSLQRAFATVDDRQTRDAKALREEISSLRQALHAMNAPSSTLQSMDSRVDALRNDVQEMFESIATLKRNEPRIVQDTRRDVNSALETARSEITRNVGLQLQQFDGTLSELHRESIQRSQELTALQMRLDQAVQSGSISGGGGTTAGSTYGGGNNFLQQNQLYGTGKGLSVGGVSNSNNNNNTSAAANSHIVQSPVVVSSQSGRTGSSSQHVNLHNSSGVAMPPGGGGGASGSRTPSQTGTAPKRDALQGAFDV